MQGSSRPDRELLDAAALCAHLVPEGSVYAFLAEHRLRLFPDEMFVDLFPTKRGRPSVPADVIATVMVLQSLEGLSDREAVRQLETNIAWKAATGLALTDEAFHSTVLVLWRNKLRTSEAPQRIFDAVRSVIVESKVLAGKTRRALDSTVLDDAVARQDTVTMLAAQIRRVRKLIPELAAVWVREHNLEPGRPPCDWDDPADRDRLVSELVDDANELVWAAEDLVAAGTAFNEKQADAVALLALVAGQDVEPGDGPGQWRITQGTAADRIISTVDPEARHAHKTRSAYRDGYKAHVAVEPDTGLITATALTPANAGDGPTGVELLAGEDPGLQVLADSAYGSGKVRAALAEAGHDTAIKAMPLNRNPRLGTDQFNRDDFIVDHHARTITCPNGITVAIATKGGATFGAKCRGCPLRSRCTSAVGGRTVTIKAHDAELVAARRAWMNGDFADDYRQHRPMVERSIAWLVAKGNRRVRYRGVERNQHGLATRVAAINLRRLVILGLDHNEQGWAVA